MEEIKSMEAHFTTSFQERQPWDKQKSRKFTQNKDKIRGDAHRFLALFPSVSIVYKLKLNRLSEMGSWYSKFYHSPLSCQEQIWNDEASFFKWQNIYRSVYQKAANQIFHDTMVYRKNKATLILCGLEGWLYFNYIQE